MLDKQNVAVEEDCWCGKDWDSMHPGRPEYHRHKDGSLRSRSGLPLVDFKILVSEDMNDD